MSLTQVTDVIVPEIFTPYVQQLTEQKARLIQSGVIARNALLDQAIAGGGLTFNIPSFQDLSAVAENISSDTAADVQTLAAGAGTTLAAQNDARPLKTNTSQEIAVRLSRNQNWSSADLAGDLAGADPMQSIANRVGFYWSRRLEAVFIATVRGLLADNLANDSGDMSVDIAGTTFVDGVTNFSAEAFLDTALTMGDSMEDLVAVMVHSVVFNRMQKNNLIDFIPDARGEIQIPTFLGREVIIDDSMPKDAETGAAGGSKDGTFETWLFSRGTFQLGTGAPKTPTAVTRQELAGNGGGQEILTNRIQWSMHPVGESFVVASPNIGGPTNTVLATASSWDRVYPERKQIKIARLITRESAVSTGSGGIPL